MEYEVENTATIVVDMQNDFCDPDGALYAEGSEEVIEKVNETMDESGVPIYYTMDTHEEGHPEFEQWGEHCVEGSWGQEIHPDVTRFFPSAIIEKDSYDAFHDTDLHERLQSAGVENLIICGTLANVCVQETASSAALHGYDVYVVGDAVGYINEEQRDSALNHIDFLFGEVISVEDL